MLTDAELSTLLPYKRKEHLATAIGRRLLDVERFFNLDLSFFLKNTSLTEADYFSFNIGPTRFRFEGSLTHTLGVWEEQLSVIVLPREYQGNTYGTIIRLTETEHVQPTLKSCLGSSCLDVRIWTLDDEYESDEAKEVAISYVLSGGAELFYCIYLHGNLDSDYLLLGSDVPREQVKNCFSIAQGGYIDLGSNLPRL